MIEEEEYSILQNKFQEWFRGIVQVAPPIPAKANRSIDNSVKNNVSHLADADHSIVDPIIPTDLPRQYAADHSHDRNRINQEDNFQKLLELLGFGCRGAITLGAGVGFILFILNFSLLGWYNNNWPNQILVIFFALLLGFYIGLSKGYVSQQRERYLYKGELEDNLYSS